MSAYSGIPTTVGGPRRRIGEKSEEQVQTSVNATQFTPNELEQRRDDNSLVAFWLLRDPALNWESAYKQLEEYKKSQQPLRQSQPAQAQSLSRSQKRSARRRRARQQRILDSSDDSSDIWSCGLGIINRCWGGLIQLVMAIDQGDSRSKCHAHWREFRNGDNWRRKSSIFPAPRPERIRKYQRTRHDANVRSVEHSSWGKCPDVVGVSTESLEQGVGGISSPVSFSENDQFFQ